MAARNECSNFGNDSSEGKSLKILILGETGVGKTSLLETYIRSVYKLPEELDLFKVYRDRKKYRGSMIDLEFFDLKRGYNCLERMASYPKDVNAILLCFSVEKYETLLNVNNQWIFEVRTHFGKNMPILLVGLKSDLRTLIAPDSGDNLVKKSEVEAIHKEHLFHGEYMECSMKDKDSVVTVIKNAVSAAIGK